MQLRDYQIDLKTGLYRSWQQGNENVVLVSPTGSGKTVTMASIAQDQSEPGVLIAHRTELVSQISLTLARFGIYHNLIGSDSTIKFCIQQHIAELGRKFFNRSASVTVASVDTVKARAGSLEQWALQQKWWMVDEAHHCLTNNKWGSTALMLVNARGVGVTATPTRADRKSLHAEQGGVFHDMVLGPSMRDLIGRGMLCDYRIYAPAQSIDLSRVRIGSTGDYSQPGLREAAHESQIVGDVVQQYQRFAAGKRGITFTVDVDLAVEIAAAFNDAGIPAMAVSAKTNDTARASAVRRFRDGEILQLVNVDLFGEGFDVPAVEVVSMARPTASYGLFVQQFGRALRPLDGKSHGIIIDHAGNVGRHGLPDAPRQWRLWDENWGQRRRNADDVVIPVTTCTECFAAYERIHKVCPYCGHAPVPDGRSRPSQVDGDLIELDEATLRAMRGDIDRIDGDAIIPHGADAAITGAVKRRHRERQEAQAELRRVMALWGGVRRDLGEDDATMQRRFFHTFGIDVMSAQALGRPEAEELTQRIQKSWN